MAVGKSVSSDQRRKEKRTTMGAIADMDELAVSLLFRQMDRIYTDEKMGRRETTKGTKRTRK
jgi:hypothetical protein